MSRHVTDELLGRFVAGRLEDEVAVAVALHIDECPWCCTRAAAAEPLHAAFASIDDPSCPPHLADEILAALDAPAPAPERAPLPEIGAALGLLALSAAMLLALGEPGELATELAIGMGAVLSALVVVGEHAASLSPLLSVLLAALGFAIVTFYGVRFSRSGPGSSPEGWA